MKKYIILISLSLLLSLNIVVNSAPKPINNTEVGKTISDNIAEELSYVELADAIRNAKNFNELQTALSTWADKQKDRVKEKNKKIKK